MLNIKDTGSGSLPDYGAPVLRLGFRPFFLGAAIFAIVLMFVWMAQSVFSINFNFSGLVPNIWHAHEMIFGYTVAVIAGFLTTAIRNWTGADVIKGKPLALLFMLWLIPRLLFLSGLEIPVYIVAAIDSLFLLSLAAVCLRPILKVKQYKQIGIIVILFLLLICNIVFYLGLEGIVNNGVRWGLYSALYLIIALVFLMMRRVMPMFIKNGVDGDVELINRQWLDITSLVLLLGLWISDVFAQHENASALISLVLVVLHLIRLSGWYVHKIWSKPLVWVLVVAYFSFIVAFALKAASFYFVPLQYLSIHAFTVGGIGLITIGMMSRVTIGHTGRNVFEPPAVLLWAFLFMFLSFVVRVIFPLIEMDLYNYWIGISQALWIVAFLIFLIVHVPMLVMPRVDGNDG